MTEQDQFMKRQPFPGWIIKEEIGRGSFGTVYRAERDGFSTAIKYMVIPDERGYRDAIRKLGTNEKVSNYYKPMVERLNNEIRVMQNLQGTLGIVLYLDHEVRELQERAGWEICIRMEYLTPLNEWIFAHGITVGQVLSIGVQLSGALEECSNMGVIHRDIKESNILLNAKGRAKLGDFGISKNLEGTERASTYAGTNDYMAPEVINRQKYDFHADMYSLGIVIYRLLNGGRMPFAPINYTVDDMDICRDRLLKGEILPEPQYGGTSCGELLRQACAYDPKDRFQKFHTMQAAIEQLLNSLDPEILGTVVIEASGAVPIQNESGKSEHIEKQSGTVAISYEAPLLNVKGSDYPVGTFNIRCNPIYVSPESVISVNNHQDSNGNVIRPKEDFLNIPIASAFETNIEPDADETVIEHNPVSLSDTDRIKKGLRYAGIVTGIILLVLSGVFGIIINLVHTGSAPIIIGCIAVLAALWGLISIIKINKIGHLAGIMAATAYFVLLVGGIVYVL